MKVKIGPYPDRLRCNIHTRYMDKKYGFVDWPAKQTKFENFLEKVEDIIQSFYNIPNRLFLDERTQKINVKLDKWDTWSMDHTLAHIVVPMLKQLKETKQGAPNVDMDDVPKHLQPTPKEEIAYQKNGETDPKFFKRWDWVMDEMIFAFESKLEDWEEKFYSGEPDIVWTKEEGSELFRMEKGPNDTFEIDMKGRKEYQDRISNGFRLFGKYYEALWD